MQTEYEATFYPINKNKLRQKLKKLGAKLIKPEFMMKRTTYKPPKEVKGSWLRVRDEGDKITMTYKIIDGTKITDQKEIELEINDFKKADELLITIGADRKAYQETLRELWHFNDCEITLDTWPGIKPIIEIESDNEKVVKTAAEKLGFNWDEAIFGGIDIIYEKELGIPPNTINNQTPLITFENPPQKYEN